jgi:transposase-like protein
MKNPPFCPNPACPCHHSDEHPGREREEKPRRSKEPWFVRKGFYTSRRSGRVHRFRCRFCGTGFSEQTFSLDYFAKRTVSYSRIEEMVCSTSSLRDIARVLHISLGTVSNRISRLARQAMAGHAEYLRRFTPKEPLVADGFESFVWSQFFPDNTNLLVTADSQLLLGATYCTIRRKGSMTEAQKKRRAELETLFRPPGSVIKHAFAELMDEAVPLVNSRCRKSGEAVELRSDEKREYRIALAEHPFYLSLRLHGKLFHYTVSSRAARTVHNPLFAVNYFDRELRKDLANHVRETVCFARNVNAAMERFWIYAVHHNLIKRYRERQPRGDSSTHASVAGIAVATARRVRLHYFTRRAFFSKIGGLPASLVLLWRRQLETPLHPNGAHSLARYAVA